MKVVDSSPYLRNDVVLVAESDQDVSEAPYIDIRSARKCSHEWVIKEADLA